MTDALVSLVTSLANPGDRSERAAELARHYGASSLLVFLCDDDVGLFLAAPGFRQTLPNGRAWQTFLSRCASDGQCTTELPIQSADELVPVVGYCVTPDAVLVLAGTATPVRDVSELLGLAPLLVRVLTGERALATANLHARTARDAVARAQMIASTLERTRHQLEAALRAAHESRLETERVNAQLTRHAHELEAANELLHTQADALAAQAMELELQANQLQMTNGELVEARAAAEAANRTKGDFLATMSHELRTPLNAIGGYAEVLSMGIHGPVTSSQAEALDRIIRSQRHLLRLINDILNLSRLEAGGLAYTMSMIALSDAIADMSPMIGPQLAAKSLRFEVRDADALPAVFADRERLQQILLNLLSNAVKFTPSGGTIWIDATKVKSPGSQGRVEVRVADTGEGIPAHKLDWIFEPFTQVDTSHSRVGQGAGLGLAISRDLARGMGGDLVASSDVGVGSVFTLSLRERP